MIDWFVRLSIEIKREKSMLPRARNEIKHVFNVTIIIIIIINRSSSTTITTDGKKIVGNITITNEQHVDCMWQRVKHPLRRSKTLDPLLSTQGHNHSSNLTWLLTLEQASLFSCFSSLNNKKRRKNKIVQRLTNFSLTNKWIIELTLIFFLLLVDYIIVVIF